MHSQPGRLATVHVQLPFILDRYYLYQRKKASIWDSIMGSTNFFGIEPHPTDDLIPNGLPISEQLDKAARLREKYDQIVKAHPELEKALSTLIDAAADEAFDRGYDSGYDAGYDSASFFGDD